MAVVTTCVVLSACGGEESKPPGIAVRNPEYLVVRTIRREADADHTIRVDLPFAGGGYGFAASSPLLDLTAFDVGAATFAGGRTSIVGEASLWLPLNPEGSRRLAAWSEHAGDDLLGIFLKGRLVAAPRLESRISGGILVRVSSKSEGDRVLRELRSGGVPE